MWRRGELALDGKYELAILACLKVLRSSIQNEKYARYRPRAVTISYGSCCVADIAHRGTNDSGTVSALDRALSGLA